MRVEQDRREGRIGTEVCEYEQRLSRDEFDGTDRGWSRVIGDGSKETDCRGVVRIWVRCPDLEVLLEVGDLLFLEKMNGLLGIDADGGY